MQEEFRKTRTNSRILATSICLEGGEPDNLETELDRVERPSITINGSIDFENCSVESIDISEEEEGLPEI